MDTQHERTMQGIDAQGEPVRLGEYNGFEVYPMPFFVTLVAEDPKALATWYQRALGFGIMFEGPIIHIRRRKYQDILIVQASPEVPATSGGPPLTFQAGGEVDAIAAQAKAEAPIGSVVIEGPVDTPWNTHDLRITDPAGHTLVFTSPREQPDPEIAARWQQAFEAGKKD